MCVCVRLYEIRLRRKACHFVAPALFRTFPFKLCVFVWIQVVFVTNVWVNTSATPCFRRYRVDPFSTTQSSIGTGISGAPEVVHLHWSCSHPSWWVDSMIRLVCWYSTSEIAPLKTYSIKPPETHLLLSVSITTTIIIVCFLPSWIASAGRSPGLCCWRALSTWTRTFRLQVRLLSIRHQRIRTVRYIGLGNLVFVALSPSEWRQMVFGER